MYQQWLAKQILGFCGTQSMVARWNQARDGKCPNCGKQEPVAHLKNEMVAYLRKWLYNNYFYPELAYWLPKYILLRGTKKLGEFPHLSPEMKTVAASQDMIPWKHFMEGKISSEIFKL